MALSTSTGGGTDRGKAIDRFTGRYVIDEQMAFPHLDRPGARAYAVTDSEDDRASLYALVHSPDFPRRHDIEEALSSHPIRSVISPVASGVSQVSLKNDEGERLVSILPFPRGGALFDQNGGAVPEITERLLRDVVIGELIKGVGALHDQGLVHRALRPENIFFSDEKMEAVLLGECASGPAGVDLPTGYEPIERALAPPSARGHGTAGDDIFALGATLMSLYQGQHVGFQFPDDDTLMVMRMQMGSYRAYCGAHEVPGSYGVMLRGLLSDDQEQRWNLGDLQQWLDGLKPPSRRAGKDWSLAKNVRFGTTNYRDRRLLAFAFARNKVDAVKFLRTLDYEDWFKSVVTTEDLGDRVLRIMLSGGGESSASDEALVAKVCVHLYPLGPFRYRGIVASLDGIAGVVAHAFQTDDQVKLEQLDELVTTGTLQAILDIALEHNPVASRMHAAIHNFADVMKRNRLGQGLERALYDLNPTLPCLASDFRDVTVRSLADLMQVMEDKVSASGDPIGRHVAAFAASREGALDSLFVAYSGAGKGAERSLALLNLLARMQIRIGRARMPNLTGYVAKSISVSIKALHNKDLRKEARKRLENLASTGDLIRLQAGLKFEEIKRLDDRSFAAAKRKLARIDVETLRLQEKVLPGDPAALRNGYLGGALLGYFAAVGAFVFFTSAG